MKKVKNEFFPFYRFDNLSAERSLVHFISSGVRNIGFTEEERPEQVVENRLLLANVVGFDVAQLVMGEQVHSAHVVVVERQDAGRGALDRESRLVKTDALVTRERGICLMVLSADCVPVLLYDRVEGVVAAVHAGWRGTVADIVGKTVGVMVREFGCLPENIVAGIGPSIGGCCFEVGREVAACFREVWGGMAGVVFGDGEHEKWRVDLWEANRRGLLAAGLLPEHVEVAGLCTVCHHHDFFSYRYDGGHTGRFGAGIMLAEEGVLADGGVNVSCMS